MNNGGRSSRPSRAVNVDTPATPVPTALRPAEAPARIPQTALPAGVGARVLPAGSSPPSSAAAATITATTAAPATATGVGAGTPEAVVLLVRTTRLVADAREQTPKIPCSLGVGLSKSIDVFASFFFSSRLFANGSVPIVMYDMAEVCL